MKDYIPPGYLSLSDALDLVRHHLFGAPAASGRGLPAQAIDWLRNVLAEEQVPAIAIAENGQTYKVEAALWRSQDALGALATGDPVNIEVDILAKYVERMLVGGPDKGLTLQALKSAGF